MTTIEDIKARAGKPRALGVDDAMFLLGLAVEEKGAGYFYINESGESAEGGKGIGCTNLHRQSDGTYVPGCIVGNVFSRLYGVEKVPYEGTANSTNHELNLPFNDDAERLLSIAQSKQDGGTSWGKAVTEAKALLDATLVTQD